MRIIYSGKTKDVYALEDGNYLLKFKDEVTGTAGVFDPGANTVGFTLAGAGQAGLALSKHFFEILKKNSIPTHYLKADLQKATMLVQPATMFGQGLEVIYRFRAVGSFFRRYGLYVKEGQLLDGLMEITLKDDQREDPLINKDALIMLGILQEAEYQRIKELTEQIALLIRDELAQRRIELYDLKLEFGKLGENQEIALIDEISGGNMRTYLGQKYLEPLELARIMTK